MKRISSRGWNSSLCSRCLSFLLLVLPAFAGEGIWLDVPFVHQEGNGCGSASIAMLIQYWESHGAGVQGGAGVQVIQDELYVPAEKGIPADAVECYLRSHGFRVFVFRGEQEDLWDHLSKGRPLLVCLKPGRGSALHFAVVAGIGDGAVALNDPADRKLRLYGTEQFLREWKAADNWTLLAVPRPHP